MKDAFGREINYLRVSVTDRCNLRCVYCMPENVKFLPHEEMLSLEELERAVTVAVRAGIKKIRLTGGEPLVRSGIEKLVKELSLIEEIEDLSLTTNGLLLSEKASALAEAGLHRVNVSLDTLDPGKFRTICRGGDLDSVLEGIRTAGAAGLSPVKVNIVVMRGRNETEIGDFLDFAAREGVTVRFIEYMPMKMDGEWEKRYVPRNEMLQSVKGRVTPKSGDSTDSSAPARYYEISGSSAQAGFISPISHAFCSRCNRLRLAPDGRLFSCIVAKEFVDLKKAMRNGSSDSELEAIFTRCASYKAQKGDFSVSPDRPMHSLGG